MFPARKIQAPFLVFSDKRGRSKPVSRSHASSFWRFLADFCSRSVRSDPTALSCRQAGRLGGGGRTPSDHLQPKKETGACYHLPRTVSQEGPSAPFLCGCLKERRREDNERRRKGSPGPGLLRSAGKGASGLILYEFNRSAEDKSARPLLPTAIETLPKRVLTANRRDGVRCSKSKARTQRGPTVAVMKATGAAFYMFILFFRVSLKESEGAIYQAGR